MAEEEFHWWPVAMKTAVENQETPRYNGARIAVSHLIAMRDGDRGYPRSNFTEAQISEMHEAMEWAVALANEFFPGWEEFPSPGPI